MLFEGQLIILKAIIFKKLNNTNLMKNYQCFTFVLMHTMYLTKDLTEWVYLFNFFFYFRVLPLHDSSQILAIKLAAYNKDIPAVREYYQQEHMNFIKVSGERSKWWVWNRSLDIAHESVKKIQTYLQRVSDGK